MHVDYMFLAWGSVPRRRMNGVCHVVIKAKAGPEAPGSVFAFINGGIPARNWKTVLI